MCTVLSKTGRTQFLYARFRVVGSLGAVGRAKDRWCSHFRGCVDDDIFVVVVVCPNYFTPNQKKPKLFAQSVGNSDSESRWTSEGSPGSKMNAKVPGKMTSRFLPLGAREGSPQKTCVWTKGGKGAASLLASRGQGWQMAEYERAVRASERAESGGPRSYSLWTDFLICFYRKGFVPPISYLSSPLHRVEKLTGRDKNSPKEPGQVRKG